MTTSSLEAGHQMPGVSSKQHLRLKWHQLSPAITSYHPVTWCCLANWSPEMIRNASELLCFSQTAHQAASQLSVPHLLWCPSGAWFESPSQYRKTWYHSEDRRPGIFLKVCDWGLLEPPSTSLGSKKPLRNKIEYKHILGASLGEMWHVKHNEDQWSTYFWLKNPHSWNDTSMGPILPNLFLSVIPVLGLLATQRM